jgi:hypothetical protein
MGGKDIFYFSLQTLETQPHTPSNLANNSDPKFSKMETKHSQNAL